MHIFNFRPFYFRHEDKERGGFVSEEDIDLESKKDSAFGRQRFRLPPGQRPLSAFLPNILTLCGMCCGITGIHMALNRQSAFAIVSVLLAGLFDGIDGKVARKLGAVSRFGAELDSLSDFATFGIVPAVIVYIFSLQSLNNMGWAVALLFAMSMALRLARFNTSSIEGTFKPWMSCFGVGVPAPSGAYMLLWPLMIEHLFQITVPAVLYAIWVVFISGLTVSRIPTFLLKSKKKTISQQKTMLSLLAIVMAIGLVYSWPWLTAVLVGIGYLVSLFISVRLCRQAKEAYDKKQRQELQESNVTRE